MNSKLAELRKETEEKNKTFRGESHKKQRMMIMMVTVAVKCSIRKTEITLHI